MINIFNNNRSLQNLISCSSCQIYLEIRAEIRKPTIILCIISLWTTLAAIIYCDQIRTFKKKSTRICTFLLATSYFVNKRLYLYPLPEQKKITARSVGYLLLRMLSRSCYYFSQEAVVSYYVIPSSVITYYLLVVKSSICLLCPKLELSAPLP